MNPEYYFQIDDSVLESYKEKTGHELDSDIVEFCLNHNAANLEKERFNREKTAEHNRSFQNSNSIGFSFLTVPMQKKLDKIADKHPDLRIKKPEDPTFELSEKIRKKLDERSYSVDKAYREIFVGSFIGRTSFYHYANNEHPESTRKKDVILGIGLGLRVSVAEMEELLATQGYKLEEVGSDGLIRKFLEKKLPFDQVNDILETLGLPFTEEEAVIFEDEF